MNPAYLTAAPMRQPQHVYSPPTDMQVYASYAEAPDSPPGFETESRENQARLDALPQPPRRNVFGELGLSNARINNSASHARALSAQRPAPTGRQSPDQLPAPDQPTGLRGAGTGRRDSLLRPAARRPVSAILAERLAVDPSPASIGSQDESNRILGRDARRRTIYVPDDTTVMTIHPGASLSQRASRRGSILNQDPLRRSRSQSAEPELDQAQPLPTLAITNSTHDPTLSIVKEESLPSLSNSGPNISISIPQHNRISILANRNEGTLPKSSTLITKKPRRQSLAMKAITQMAHDLTLSTVSEEPVPSHVRSRNKSERNEDSRLLHQPKSKKVTKATTSAKLANSSRPALNNVTNKRSVRPNMVSQNEKAKLISTSTIHNRQVVRNPQAPVVKEAKSGSNTKTSPAMNRGPRTKPTSAPPIHERQIVENVNAPIARKQKPGSIEVTPPKPRVPLVKEVKSQSTIPDQPARHAPIARDKRFRRPANMPSPTHQALNIKETKSHSSVKMSPPACSSSKGELTSTFPTYKHQVSDNIHTPILQESESHIVAKPFSRSSHQLVEERKATQSQFTVLKDDLAQPGLYEECWLQHQEIAFTQILNMFFESSNGNSEISLSHESRRSEFVKMYNSPEMMCLTTRLRTSLLCGALAVPYAIFAKALPLRDDFGLRRKYLNLFLEVYDLDILQAVAEAIAGRECKRPDSSPVNFVPSKVRDSNGRYRSVEAFLDAFFVRHDDISGDVKTKLSTMAGLTSLTGNHSDQIGSPMWAWRRTLIRSFMLIFLLDQAKAAGAIRGCLFQPLSPIKSSEAAVRAVAALLLPSYGDVMRPLKHLRYEVSVVQHPLEEFDYHVKNLATDLRDGIRIARVVELLYPQKFGLEPLSPQLKYPCPSRAQKLHNVAVALGSVIRLDEYITVEDIVDGHREKSLSLLWTLMGYNGMGSLVNWDMVRAEISLALYHLSQDPVPSIDVEYYETFMVNLEANTKENCYSLLLAWATTTAAQYRVEISNATTSFADLVSYDCILHHYLPYVTKAAGLHTSTPALKLRAIGCSAAFVDLFMSSTSSIPTEDLTMMTLTFLAARLLPAVQRFRAAATIGRAYQARLARREASKRIVLMRLARHCAIVVGARDRVVNATVVLQRAWRRVLDRKIGLLERDVTMLQTVARGFLLRNREKKGVKRGVRAGW